MKSWPPIDEAELMAAYEKAATPARTISPRTVEIFRHTAALRGARKRGASPQRAWAKLRDAMDAAVLEDDWTALDDFAAAWKLKGLEITGLVVGGDLLIEGEWKREPIRRRTLEVVGAVMDLQEKQAGVKTAPSREEIREKVGCGITEVKEVLNRLGWLARFPTR